MPRPDRARDGHSPRALLGVLLAVGLMPLLTGRLPGLPTCRLTTGLLGGVEVAAVVPTERALLAFADIRVWVDVRGVLDLILGHGQHNQLAVEPGSLDRREALPGAEQAGLPQDPLRLPGLLVEVHLADLADPVALGVNSGTVAVIRTVLRGGHSCLPCRCRASGVRLTRRDAKQAELPCQDSNKQLLDKSSVPYRQLGKPTDRSPDRPDLDNRCTVTDPVTPG